MKISRYGQVALPVGLSTLAEVHALDNALHAQGWDDIEECIPAYDTVVVRARPGTDISALAQRIVALTLDPDTVPSSRLVIIDVVYDGVDLSDVAALTGLAESRVIQRHTAPEHTVAFLGFTPGFPYLVGLDPALIVPRLESPRLAVPAGSVAIGGGQTGVYPLASPGGWRIIGRTTATLWDAQRTPASLLQPGDRLRFCAVERA